MKRLFVLLIILGAGLSFAESAATATDQSTITLSQPAGTTDGSITILDLQSTSPHLLLLTEGGRKLMVSVDPTTTSVVWGNGWKMRLDKFLLGPEPHRLRVRSDVEVSHTLKNGEQLATAIRVLGARPMMALSVAP